MLVLTRRLGETIVIDGNITVEVVEIDGNRIKLGVTAPREVRVDRKEIHDERISGIPKNLRHTGHCRQEPVLVS